MHRKHSSKLTLDEVSHLTLLEFQRRFPPTGHWSWGVQLSEPAWLSYVRVPLTRPSTFRRFLKFMREEVPEWVGSVRYSSVGLGEMPFSLTEVPQHLSDRGLLAQLEEE